MKSGLVFGIFSLLSFFAYIEAKSDVVVLTKSNFDETLKKQSLMLVKFYAPWCGHCKALAPEFEKAASKLKDLDVPLAEVDCTTEADICGKQKIESYPTLKIYRKGNPSIYESERNSASIVSFMTREVLPTVSELKADELEKFKTRDKVVVVGFFADNSGSEVKMFKETAEKMKEKYIFGFSTDQSLAEKEGSKVPGVVLYKEFDDGKNVFPEKLKDSNAKLNSNNLKKFIEICGTPLIEYIGPNNYLKFHESGLPIGFIFVDSTSTEQDMAKIFEPMVGKYEGKMMFVYLDVNLYGGQAESLNLEPKWPAFGIEIPDKGLKYPYSQDKEINSDTITEFIEEYFAGNVKPSVRSEPIPENNDGPVTVGVADNLAELAFNKEKDVMVEFYAPWCGYCQKIAPSYEKLAKSLKDIDSVELVKVDATANDVPPEFGFSIQGYPTFKFFKAKSNEVLDFDGDLTGAGILKFISSNAEIPFKAPTIKWDSEDNSAEEVPEEPEEPAETEEPTEAANDEREESPAVTEPDDKVEEVNVIVEEQPEVEEVVEKIVEVPGEESHDEL